jgi:hypothetical protein
MSSRFILEVADGGRRPLFQPEAKGKLVSTVVILVAGSLLARRDRRRRGAHSTGGRDNIARTTRPRAPPARAASGRGAQPRRSAKLAAKAAPKPRKPAHESRSPWQAKSAIEASRPPPLGGGTPAAPPSATRTLNPRSTRDDLASKSRRLRGRRNPATGPSCVCLTSQGWRTSNRRRRAPPWELQAPSARSRYVVEGTGPPGRSAPCASGPGRWIGETGRGVEDRRLLTALEPKPYTLLAPSCIIFWHAPESE